MALISLHDYDFTKTTELLQFTENNPWKPRWPKEMAERFLSQLVSTYELVFDFHNETKRMAVAVLIDEIQNIGNHACLEFLGVDPKIELTTLYDSVIRAAKLRLPSLRAGFEITLHNDLHLPADFFQNHGLRPYYETYEMFHDQIVATAHLKTDFIHPLTPADEPEYYDVLRETFRNNPDFSAPSFSDWKVAQRKSATSYWIFKQDSQILGFITLVMSDHSPEGEIMTVGVIPKMRGKGLGRTLLTFGLNEFAKCGITKCSLTVATQNESALKLYQNLGFKIQEHYRVYCYSVPVE